MKRIFSLFLALGLFVFAVSCNKETSGNETGYVSFRVELPGSIQSKAISDGTKALTLYYATYTEEGKMLSSLSNVTNGVEVVGKTATVNFQLVKDLKFHIVFWAQAADCEAFTFDWEAAEMTVSYDGVANDDYRDAFYAVVRNVVVDGEDGNTYYNEDGQEPVKLEGAVGLYRPFAQINFGASDYAYVTEYYDQQSVDTGMTSSFVVAATEVPNKLNLLERGVSGAAAVNFTSAPVPVEEDDYNLVVGGQEYRYLAMNYVLAPAGEEPAMISAVAATFAYEDGGISRTIPVENVPILRNHRTNILGDLFTVNTPITIVVMEKFNDDLPEHIITWPQGDSEEGDGNE